MMPLKTVRHFPSHATLRQRGLTLIELMVAMLIGLLLALAMVSALMFGEAQRRTTSAGSDTDQSGAYVASVLDTALRNAGSDLMRSAGPLSAQVLGCNPGFAAATSAPTPFNQFLGGNLGNLSVAPVLIESNPTNASPPTDILAVMSGSGAAGGIPRTVLGAAGATLTLPNTIGIAANSRVLIDQPNSSANCSIQTVTAVNAGGTTLTLSAAPASNPSIVLPLGDPSEVQFQLFGVDRATATLASYDLLTNTSRPMASNVVAMQALYGVAGSNGQLAQWVAPTAASGYDPQTLMADQDKLRQIVAVRIALILQSALYEKDATDDNGQKVAVSAGRQLSWFNPVAETNTDLTGIQFIGLSVPQTWTPAADTADEHHRYKVIEFVVPMRNSMIVN